ncbi:hypothetical protein BKA70DRAFT_459715 [Coprinopsis sp. MPI-PUGE-AT-0042]|nr:hypothetical protein BKA70DRAFT_459715 [Coprinopsis sp. MPI-PUGE-AT-0042]
MTMRKNMHSRITVNEQTIEDLREELGPDTWFCSFHDFKARLLPGSLAPEKVQAIRKNLEEKGILTVGKGFRSYPVEPDGSGPDYYIPFRDAANAIQHDPLLRDVTRKQPSEPGFQSTWVTTNNQPLQSIEPKASKSRPDISCMVSSGLSKDHIAEKIAKELDHWEDQAMRENRKRKRQAEETDTGLPASVATMSTPAAGAGMTDTASEPERNPGARSEEELMWYQWLMSVMVVEIEPTDPSTYEVTSDIIFQEAKHMKHILQEQHDRRFVFGIIIFHNKMTLWYCDRAGLLGTYDAINIQTDPDAFIEVMALFAIMSPFEHGWDESMKLLIFNSIPDSDGTVTRQCGNSL